MIHRKRMTADEVYRVLAQKYAPPRYLYGAEVGNTTGWSPNKRYADMVVLEIWPSDGCHIHGIEIKVSSSDLKTELTDMSKSGAIKKYCDYWWLAVPHNLILDENTIPDDWGILRINSKVHITRRAPKLQPLPLNRRFLASLVRCVRRSLAADVRLLLNQIEG